MSNGSWSILLSVTLALGGCAAARRSAVSIEPVESPNRQALVSDMEFQKGRKLLENGDHEAALACFDRVIDMLLAIPNPADTQPDQQKKLLEEYTTKIADLELSLFKDQSVENSSREEDFLDEMVSAPLFPLSEKDVREFQKKIEAQPAVTYSVPMVINSQVLAFLKSYQNTRHERIQNALSRGMDYLGGFKEIFKKYGLPEDLVFLPLIESGYRNIAVSRAGARGMWQFMASTARLFGLRIDGVVDERLDPFKSAEAAAK